MFELNHIVYKKEFLLKDAFNMVISVQIVKIGRFDYLNTCLGVLDNFEFLNKFKNTESTSHLEISEFSNVLTEGRKPQVDDIFYSSDELQRLSNQGVDVSNFLVANGIESGKKRVGKKFLSNLYLNRTLIICSKIKLSLKQGEP